MYVRTFYNYFSLFVPRFSFSMFSKFFSAVIHSRHPLCEVLVNHVWLKASGTFLRVAKQTRVFVLLSCFVKDLEQTFWWDAPCTSVLRIEEWMWEEMNCNFFVFLLLKYIFSPVIITCLNTIEIHLTERWLQCIHSKKVSTFNHH